MRRGNQFMGADQITFDQEEQRYTAEGSIRYQGGGLRLNDRRAFAFFLRGDLHACEPDQRGERQHDDGG